MDVNENETLSKFTLWLHETLSKFTLWLQMKVKDQLLNYTAKVSVLFWVFIMIHVLASTYIEIYIV